MARIGIISDIHGNLHALLAVLAEIEEVGVDAIVCLGDVVGYGPQPGACLELVDQRCDQLVIGNHERAVLDPVQATVFNAEARVGIEYSVAHLNPRQRSIIEEMPESILIAPGIECVHESPVPVDSGGYVRATSVAGRVLSEMDSAICFIGHTHVPAAFMLERGAAAEDVRRVILFSGGSISIREDRSYLLNPGSVGQPRDGDCRASWGLLDLDRRTFSLHRTAYEIDRAEMAVHSAGLPSVLGARLRVGA